jgi:hypothetical protein
MDVARALFRLPGKIWREGASINIVPGGCNLLWVQSLRSSLSLLSFCSQRPAASMRGPDEHVARPRCPHRALTCWAGVLAGSARAPAGPPARPGRAPRAAGPCQPGGDGGRSPPGRAGPRRCRPTRPGGRRVGAGRAGAPLRLRLAESVFTLPAGRGGEQSGNGFGPPCSSLVGTATERGKGPGLGLYNRDAVLEPINRSNRRQSQPEPLQNETHQFFLDD